MTNAKIYTSYEIGCEGSYTIEQMKNLYNETVDKTEYETFDIWLFDMLKSGVFEEETIEKVATDLFNDTNDILDGYHYYTKEEVEENKDIFVSAILNKDINYLNEVKKNFDEEIEEEKEIINKIDFLLSV